MGFIKKWVDKRIELKIQCTVDRVQMIEDCLKKKRIANFLKVVEYKKGMEMFYKPPEPISLEELEGRITDIENRTL